MGQMQRRSDAFAIRLAQAVNDDAILYYRSTNIIKPVVRKIPTEKVNDIKEENKVVSQPKPGDTNERGKARSPLSNLSEVRRLELIRTAGGLKITYEVQESGGKDIVIIEIPKEY